MKEGELCKDIECAFWVIGERRECGYVVVGLMVCGEDEGGKKGRREGGRRWCECKNWCSARLTVNFTLKHFDSSSKEGEERWGVCWGCYGEDERFWRRWHGLERRGKGRRRGFSEEKVRIFFLRIIIFGFIPSLHSSPYYIFHLSILSPYIFPPCKVPFLLPSLHLSFPPSLPPSLSPV